MFSAEGLHFPARTSTIPQNLCTFIRAQHAKKNKTLQRLPWNWTPFESIVCMRKSSNHVALPWVRARRLASFSGYACLTIRLVDCHEYERMLFSVGSRLLWLFTPVAAEASRLHPGSLLAAAASSCLSSEKIHNVSNQKISQNKTKKRLSKEIGITMPKGIQTRCRHGGMQ